MKLQKQIQEQALDGDSVCTELLAETTKNATSFDGKAWIDTQLDIEDDEDDFRPY